MVRDKRTNAAGDRRRAGVYLAQLDWLAGYPDDEGWRRLVDDLAMPLDGAAVAKARRTARTVMREHPDGLAKLVGDVPRWWSIVDAKLAWMSRAIAGKGGGFDPLPLLPARLATSVRALWPTRIGPAARAAASSFAEHPDVLAQLIGWLGEHRELAIENDLVPGWRVAFALARLAIVGDRGKARGVRERGVDALIRLCEVDAPDGRAAIQASRTAENRLRRQDTKARILDPVRSRRHVVPWIARLATRDTAHRQRVLALVAEARLAEALRPWQEWERTHEVLLQRAAALAESNFESAVERSAAETKMILKIEKSRAAAPVQVSIKDALLELDMLGAGAFARVQPSIARVLAALPAAWGVAGPGRMLLHTARVAATADDDEHPEWVWDALAAALDDGAPLSLLDPWSGLLASDHRLYLESDILEHAKRRVDVQRAIRVAVALAWAGPVTGNDLERACSWLAAGLDEGRVPEVTAATRAIDGWMLVELGRAILAIAESTSDITAFAARLLDAIGEWSHSTTKALCTLIEHAAATGGRWLIRAALEDHQAESLSAIGEMLALLPHSKRPPLTREVDSPWIAPYPAALHPALHRLASVDPEAERTAAKRLADDLPDPAALREEIAALRLRLDKPGVAKRLANLEDRLANPRPPSQARLDNLTAKLERSARDIGMSRFTRAIIEGASARILRAFGLPVLPAWAEAPKTIALLIALLSLEERDRELAGRLIRARSGDRPWDLRDEPANRAFLAELRRANLDPAPWLDDTPRAYGDLTLELTGDPIEVFAMGAHFGTCLSPDGGNFFSVVANAADVNKRVIYAKRDGRVIGRCLIALTDTFAILSFNVYAHEQVQLDAHVRDFVLELATKMGTTVAPRGTVRLLLARDWYDDGPRDLVGRFRGLDEAGLDFATLDPATFPAVLRSALDREIDDVTLPVILGHAGLAQRPELVIPLAPYILASAAPLTHVTAAELAFRAGDRQLADRFLGDHAGVIRLADHPWHHGELLAELRPSFTLARLRETRRKEVRTWEDERGDRCAVAGVALEALHRPKQALAMYELALREDWLEPHLVARMKRLGEEI
jgi:hypothetical protein